MRLECASVSATSASRAVTIAAEDVDAAVRHLRLHEPAIGRPEEIRREPRPPRIVARGAHAVDDVAGTALEAAEELDGELRRLLQIGRHHGEVRARRFDETGANRRERAEVARHLEELRGEARARQRFDQRRERAVGAAVDDEDDFEPAVERAVHARRARRGDPESSPRCGRRGLRASSGLPSVARGRDRVDLGGGELRVAWQAQDLRARALRVRESLRRRLARPRLPVVRHRIMHVGRDAGCRKMRAQRLALLRAHDVEMRDVAAVVGGGRQSDGGMADRFGVARRDLAPAAIPAIEMRAASRAAPPPAARPSASSFRLPSCNGTWRPSRRSAARAVSPRGRGRR